MVADNYLDDFADAKFRGLKAARGSDIIGGVRVRLYDLFWCVNITTFDLDRKVTCNLLHLGYCTFN